MIRLRFAPVTLALALFAAASLLPAPAEAAKLHFGPDERLNVIAETKIFDGSKTLSLCYKTYTYFVIAGVYTTDEYVLCEGGASTRYRSLTSVEIAGLQQQGLLPSPLPAYSRPVLDYVFGYSLWLLIVVIAAWTYFETRRSKAEAPKKLAQLKSTARRVMARAATTSAAPERSVAVARDLYQRLFGEALTEADFASDMTWVQSEPVAFEGFVGAMSRKFDNKAKGILLHAAAQVAKADGALVAPAEDALRLLAKKLGFKSKDTETFLTALRLQQAPASSSQPSADTLRI